MAKLHMNSKISDSLPSASMPDGLLNKFARRMENFHNMISDFQE